MAGSSKSTRIGIHAADILRSATSSHGIANYTVDLVRGLVRSPASERLHVYANADSADEFSGLDDVTLRVLPTPSTPWARLYLDNYRIEREASKDGLDALHYPRGFIARLRAGSHRRVVTIHDDIPMQYASGRWGRPHLKWRYFASAIRLSLVKADQVITDSGYIRRQLQDWSRQWRIDPPPMTVVHPLVAIDPHLASTDKGDYVLMFVSDMPHKRSALGLDLTVGYLKRRGLDMSIRLVGRYPHDLTDSSRVTHVGENLDRDQIHRLIARANCLVFPSEYEGFGLPPVEAYQLRTPCVFAQTPTSEEIMAGIPTGFDAGNVDSFDSAMDTALGFSSKDVDDIGGMLADRFSEEATVKAALNVYQSAMNARA